MFILHESIWWLIATGAVGLYLGYLKGMARWGLLLGLIFGPIGLAIMLFLPVKEGRASRGFRDQGGFRDSGVFRQAGADPQASGATAGPACPRCGKGVGRGNKACPHCGNVLIPIRYSVSETSGS
ncbi:MAG: zinc ribbon domain-containing protein [Fibrobacteria bacterium]